VTEVRGQKSEVRNNFSIAVCGAAFGIKERVEMIILIRDFRNLSNAP